jgi:sirohydrochlorin cobaltochelatase
MTALEDKRAPMAAAPLKYSPDGAVDWGNMWDTFCALAQEGGPPHRGTMLHAPERPDTASAGYRFAADEIIRGVAEVSGLRATAAAPGWIAIACGSVGMARWLSEAIERENVRARCDGALLLVPVGEDFTLKGEIKNVITAVAKTTHYWQEHLAPEVKRALALEQQLARLTVWLGGWRRRQPA